MCFHLLLLSSMFTGVVAVFRFDSVQNAYGWVIRTVVRHEYETRISNSVCTCMREHVSYIWSNMHKSTAKTPICVHNKR